jgi:hypothetical protein
VTGEPDCWASDTAGAASTDTVTAAKKNDFMLMTSTDKFSVLFHTLIPAESN